MHIEPAGPLCSWQAFSRGWCECRRDLALSPAAGVEAARAHPILRRSALFGLPGSYRTHRCGGGQERQQGGNGAG